MVDLAAYDLEPRDTKEPCIGQRIGRLTILSTGRRPNSRKTFAVCDCDCGKRTVTRLDGLRGGTTASCGCAHRDAVTKHGFSSHPLYTAWHNMMRRCYDPRNNRWTDYGGRGIRVCPDWQNIRQFVADMADSYSPSLEIDRRDVNGDYELGNCHWVTHEVQARNKRTSIYVTIRGETKTVAEWARERGLAYGTVWERIKVLGWDPVKAVTLPALDADTRCARARNARRHTNL